MLLIETKNAVRTISLNRPDVKNAMDAATIAELTDAFRSIEPEIRAVVLKGAGDFFCAGGDIQWMKDSRNLSESENRKDALKLAQMIRAVDECPVPVLTLVKGGAFGGGVGLVAVSDIVIAEENAIFSLSEVKLGLIPATIGPVVMRKIGLSQARKLYLTGMRFSAILAKEIGLVHDVVPASSLQSVLQHYLTELSSSAPQAVRVAKQLIRDTMGHRLWQATIMEETSEVLSTIRVGPEAQEGLSAFFEKRAPQWKLSSL